MKYLSTKIIVFYIGLFLITACDLKKTEESVEEKNAAQKNIAEKVDISDFTAAESKFKPIVPQLLGKDIATYLENEALSQTALFYYLGKTEASPEKAFLSLFDSLSTNDPLNPLHWHLLNKAVMNSDGALAETLSHLVAEKIEEDPLGFTQMLLDTTYAGRMEVAKNHAFLLAHDIQKSKEAKQAEEKLIIRAMLTCSTCTDQQKAVLDYFFGMVDGLKD